MAGPPVVDYTATSVRPGWRALPEALRRSLAVALGTEIAEAGPSVGSGFTGGFAAPLRLADGREVFVKAAPDTMHAYGAYQREAEIVPLLPPAVRVPPIIAAAHATTTDSTTGSTTAGLNTTDSQGEDRSEGERQGQGAGRGEGASQGRGEGAGRGQGEGDIEWFAVAAERVVARMPGGPWTPEDFRTVTANCEAVAVALTPTPLPGLPTFIADVESEGFPKDLPEQILRGDRPVPDGFQPWIETRLRELQDLVDLYPEALKGDAAIHGDLRPDNLLIDANNQCWTVDWNWLALGPNWLDWVGLLPLAHRDGIDTTAAIKTSWLTADVPADYIDCFAAVIAVYMLNNLDAPPPPGCTPELRRHQRLYAWAFLDWLAVRRRW